MREKTFTLIFNDFDESHLGKDVFLVPFYWCKINHTKGSIVYPSKNSFKKLPSIYRDICLIPLNIFFRKSRKSYLISALIYLLKNARKIDTLMQFHFSDNTLYCGNLFKLIHPKGFLYIKCDGEYWLDEVLSKYDTKRGIKGKIKKYLFARLLKKTDLITIETENGYQKLQERKYCGVCLKVKSRLLENGFDQDLIDKHSIQILKPSEKENIIITVGRLGTKDKNTELILKAAEKICLKDWKIILIGPIETNFQIQINNFLKKNPQLTEKVIFTGTITDKKELWEWYNKSKVFLLTSRNESFGLVLMEAYFFNDYIISTDVGWARTAIKKSFGKIIHQEDPISLENAIQDIIDKKIDITYNPNNIKDISYETLIKNALSSYEQFK